MKYVVFIVCLMIPCLRGGTVNGPVLKRQDSSACMKSRATKSNPHTRLRYDMGGGTEIWFFSYMRCRMKGNEDYTYYRYREIPKNGRVYYGGGGTLEIRGEKFIYLGKTNLLHTAGNWGVEPTTIRPNSFIW